MTSCAAVKSRLGTTTGVSFPRPPCDRVVTVTTVSLCPYQAKSNNTIEQTPELNPKGLPRFQAAEVLSDQAESLQQRNVANPAGFGRESFPHLKDARGCNLPSCEQQQKLKQRIRCFSSSLFCSASFHTFSQAAQPCRHTNACIPQHLI